MYKRYLKIGGISRKEISTLELDSFDRFRSFYSLKKLSLHKNVMEINIKDYMLLENKKNVGIIKKKLRENRLKD